MIFHENRLLSDDSYVISYLFCRKLGKMSQMLSSAAVVIVPLRVKMFQMLTNLCNYKSSVVSLNFCGTSLYIEVLI